MSFLRVLAIAALAVLTVLTIVPDGERPITFLPHHVEHFLAFGVTGGLIALAFAMETFTMAVAAARFTVGLECMQIPLPTRHARLSDIVVDTAAICMGVLLVRLWRARTSRDF
ncbi:MAG: VanZ family protein [Rhodopseudomonas palustris]|nr:VanZ family protein [Rhodopseudomonas palustris]